MPEDVHPDFAKASNELASYFTLGMSLNYQRTHILSGGRVRLPTTI